MTTTTQIPEGYMQNAAGHLVPSDQVREQDKLRDETVRALVAQAIELNRQLRDFKARALADIEDLIQIAAERYDTRVGGRKGNVDLASFDGRYKVQRRMADQISFTEELEAAKALINTCIDRWSEGSNANIRALVDRAFRTNTQGQLKTTGVLDLLRLEIEDEDWQKAMEALRDSLHVVGTSVYVRLYERQGNSDHYSAIALDLAAV